MGSAYAQFMNWETACLFPEFGNGVYEISRSNLVNNNKYTVSQKRRH